jgi:hypothetical protein
MEELAKKIQEKYIDDITAKYPLHRFFCLFTYLLSFYIYYVKREERLISAFTEVKISYIFDFSDGLLSEVSVLQLLIAIICTLLVARLSNLLKTLFFNFFSSLHDFNSYVIKLIKSVEEVKPQNNAIAWSLTSDIGKQLEMKRVKLRSKQSIAEIVLTFIVCMLIGLINLNIVDAIIIIGGILIIVFAHWESFKIYISEFMPYYVAEQILLGKDVTFIKGSQGL